MNTLSYKTKSAKKEEVQRAWHIVDAEGETIGRMCTKIATILRGKHKTSYTPHVDTGDYVIVINSSKAKFTGNKMADKYYLSFSGYAGGQKSRTAQQMMAKKPTWLVENAVRGMLPKNKLGRAMFRKLFVYADAEHPHAAQKPESLKISLMEMINTIGRRKASVARIYLRKGTPGIKVNGKDYKDYFVQPHIQLNIEDPFKTLDIANEFDILVNVNGGGYKGQAEAVRMAISRALVKLNEDYRKPLKEKKYLMRDARVVERKKYGRPKARKSFQFSKR